MRRAAGRRARSTSAGPGPAGRDDPPARRARRARCSAPPIPRDEAGRDPAPRSASRVAEAADGLDVTVPALAARRRHARGRPRRGGRAAGRARQAARTLPSRRGAAGVLAPEQRLRRRAEDALVGRGAARDRRLELRRARPRRPAAAARPTTRAARVVALRNPMSEDQSVLRTTLLGSLLDVARRNRARGDARRPAVRDRRVYLDQPRGGEPTAAERRSEPLPEERQHVGALLAGAVRAAVVARRRAAAGRLLRRQGLLAALLDALRVPWTRRARRASRSCIPAARARVLVGGEPRGLARRGAPAGRARVGPRRRRAASSSTSALRRGARRCACRATRTSRPSRRCGRTSRRRRATTCRPPTCSPSSRERGRRAAARRRGLRRLPRRAGRRRSLARAARVPAPRPHADRRGGRAAAREDRRGAGRAPGGELRG